MPNSSHPVAMCRHFTLIGMADGVRAFDAAERQAISTGCVFAGAARIKPAVTDLLPDNAVWLDITVPLTDVWQRFEPYNDIVVFVSGDPLFYGLGVTLRRVYPDCSLTVYPVFNSLQRLAHIAGLPYGGMVCVSLTGRDWPALDAALTEGREMIGILTDRVHTPDSICSRMAEYGYDNYRVTVGCRLGSDKQTVTEDDVQAIALRQWATPNCMILRRTGMRQRPFGVPDSWFELLDGRTRMITKMPIRLLTLSMLDLRSRSVMWDIGACTGSVSVEAALQFPQLRIVSFEIRGSALVETNARRMGTPQVMPVAGDFMNADLSSLPIPDAVFIGGHGGRLVEMMQRIATHCSPGTVVVINAVSPETESMFEQGVELAGMSVVERHRIALDNYNPVTVIKAICQ